MDRVRQSESILQGELNRSHVAVQRSDRTGGAWTGVDIAVRQTEIRMIQGIKKLRPKLDLLALSHGKDLAHPQIEIHKTRPDEDIVSGIAVRIILRIGER